MSVTPIIVLCVGVLAFRVDAVSNSEKEQISQSILPHILKCSQEVGMTDGQNKDAKDTVNPLGLNPCFLACVLKNIGYIDKNGTFAVEAAREKTKKFVSNEKDLASFENILKVCAVVNDKEVSDGIKGCDRARMLVNCFMENKVDLTSFKF